jgi:hypothetical protein
MAIFGDSVPQIRSHGLLVSFVLVRTLKHRKVVTNLLVQPLKNEKIKIELAA